MEEVREVKTDSANDKQVIVAFRKKKAVKYAVSWFEKPLQARFENYNFTVEPLKT